MTIDKNILNYVGDIRQIGGLKRYAFLDGKAKGVEAIDFDNGNGLTFTVLADRCLDIDSLKFDGAPLAFLSRTGVVAPTLFNDRGFEWLRSFSAGFLTTCGLSQVGEPCVYEGEQVCLHGIIANTPADSYNVSQKWIDGRFVMQVNGVVRQAKQQGDDLRLDRTITCVLGENSFRIDDVITNEGVRPEPFMILYHMNFGYPLINPDCDVVIPVKTTDVLAEASRQKIDTYNNMPPPGDEFVSDVFLHKLHDKGGALGEFMLTDNKENPKIAVNVQYPMDVLHTLAQWRMPLIKDYVMALEPCNNSLKGITYDYENGSLQFLQPGETVPISISVSFLDDTDKILAKKDQLLKI